MTEKALSCWTPVLPQLAGATEEGLLKMTRVKVWERGPSGTLVLGHRRPWRSVLASWVDTRNKLGANYNGTRFEWCGSINRPEARLEWIQTIHFIQESLKCILKSCFNTFILQCLGDCKLGGKVALKSFTWTLKKTYNARGQIRSQQAMGDALKKSVQVLQL